MLNNLEVDMTCIFNQEPVKIALTFCALGTCKIDQKGAVEVEGKVILQEGQYVLSYGEAKMNENQATNVEVLKTVYISSINSVICLVSPFISAG